MRQFFTLILIMVWASVSFAGNFQASLDAPNTTRLTRAATIQEYDGTVDASGNLIDVSGSNYCQYSEAIDSWTLQGSVTVTPNVGIAPDGTLTADLVEGITSAGDRPITKYSVIGAEDDPYIPSFWIKVVAPSAGDIDVSSANGTTYGRMLLYINKLPVGKWVRVYPGHPATYQNNSPRAWTAWAGGNAGFVIDTISGTLDAYIWGVQISKPTNGLEPGTYHPVASTNPLGQYDLTPYPAGADVDVHYEFEEPGKIPQSYIDDAYLYVDFSQDPASPLATNDGAWTFTKSGTISREKDGTTPTGDGIYWHDFDGASDYWARSSDGTLNPAGDFSAVCAINTNKITGFQHIFGKQEDAKYGWYLFTYLDGLWFRLSDDGTQTAGHYSDIHTTTSIVPGVDQFVTITYDYVTDGTSVMKMYHNSLATVSNAAASGPVFSSSGDLRMGKDGTYAYYMDGRIYGCAYYDGIIIPEASHDTMYADFTETGTFDHTLPGTPTFWTDMSTPSPDSPNEMVTGSGHVMQASGDPVRHRRGVSGYSHEFDDAAGAIGYWTRADDDSFDFGSEPFSIFSCFMNNSTTTYGDLIGKYRSGLNDRAYRVYQWTGHTYFYVSKDGITGHTVMVSNSIKGGVVQCITVSYDPTPGDGSALQNIYLDDFTPEEATDAPAPLDNTVASLEIGSSNLGGAKFPGRVLNMLIHKGRAFTQADHNALRASVAGLCSKGDCTTNVASVTSAAPPATLVAYPDSGVEPFFVGNSANSWRAGAKGVFAPEDITNLTGYSDLCESVDGSNHPLGWITAEAAAGDVHCVKTDSAVGRSSVYLTSAAPGDYGSVYTPCIATGVNGTVNTGVWVKRGSADTTTNIRFRIIEYATDAACGGGAVTQDYSSQITVPSENWYFHQDTIVPGDWTGAAQSYRIQVLMNWAEDGEVYLDAFTVATTSIYDGTGCFADAAGAVTCTATTPAIPNPMGTGDFEVELTSNTPWAGDDSAVHYILGTTAGAQRNYLAKSSGNVALWALHDKNNTYKESTQSVTSTNWPADEDIIFKFQHRDQSHMPAWINGVRHSVTGTSVTRGSVLPTYWMGISATNTSDAWVRDLHFTSKIRPGPARPRNPVRGNNRNPLPAIEFDGNDQYFSHADAVPMRVYNTDFTVTAKFKLHSRYANAGYIMNKAGYHGAGCWMYYSGGVLNMRCHKSGAHIDTTYTATLTDDQWHVVQFVRADDIGTMYIDGDAGTPSDLSTYGVDGSNTFTIGGTSGDNGNQQIAYLRIDAEALTAAELQEDRQRLQGTFLDGEDYTFTRASEAYSINTTGPLSYWADGIPRVDDGILLEGAATNYAENSEHINSWSTTGGTVVVQTDAVMAPNGTMTAERISNFGSNNAAKYRQYVGAPAGTYTFSIWARADIPHMFRMTPVDVGVGVANSDFYATKEWQRFEAAPFSMTGPTSLHYRIYAGISTVASGTLDVWGAQLEDGPFATSYIETPSTTPVTRTADSMTMDWDSSFPQGTGQYGVATMTIDLDAKCAFASSTDMPPSSRLLHLEGASSSTSNLISLYYSNGYIWFLHDDNAGTANSILAGPDKVDYSEWHNIRAYVDFTDISRNRVYVNGVDDTQFTDTGTADMVLGDHTLYFGNRADGTSPGYCKIKNPKIRWQ